MDYRKIIREAHEAADNLLSKIEADAKARYTNDEIGKLNFEIGMLHGTIRNLMVDLELKYKEHEVS